MASSLIDYRIYRDSYSTVSMRRIFNEQATVETWVEVERAAARAQGKAGVIPQNAADAIAAQLDAGRIDLDLLAEDTEIVGRPVVGLVKQLYQHVDEQHRPWVHYGFTTYDVMDTATVLQLRRGVADLQQALDCLRQHWEALAATHRDTLMIGRTNGQHAQPTSFGARVAVWIDELLRHQLFLETAMSGLSLQFGGMVGSLASFDQKGLLLRDILASELDLNAIASNWHNARDGLARVIQQIGLLAASLHRTARDIASLESTDIGELAEAGDIGRGRSSGMPHKRNPRAAEFAEGVALLARQRAAGITEVMGQDHERSGGSYIAEWALIPDVLLLASGAIRWMTELTERLVVDEHRMRANIDALNGLVMSERFTLALATRMSKLDARALVDTACATAWRDGRPLAAALGELPDVAAHFDSAALSRLAQPENYLGVTGNIVDRVLARSRARRFQSKTGHRRQPE